MNPELQAYLDGALRLEDLPAALQVEAKRWDRLLADARTLGQSEAPEELESRILAALPARRAQPNWRRAVEWTVRPRTIRISPLASLAAAAVVAFLIYWPLRAPQPTVSSQSDATIFVQFVLEAPGASSVAVAGDFNNWTPAQVLADPDGDGVWTGRVALRPGVHQYMFVIDGSEWQTDPHAERYADDGFGNQNAVLVLATPMARS